MESELAQKVGRDEFDSLFKERTSRQRAEAKLRFEGFEKKLAELDRRVDEGFEYLDKKVQDLEVNSLWKIQEQERVLATRVNEDFVKDFVAAELAKFQSSYVDFTNQRLPPIERRLHDHEQKVAAAQREVDKLFQKLAAAGPDTDRKLRETLSTIKAYVDSHLGDQKDAIENASLKSESQLRRRLDDFEDRVVAAERLLGDMLTFQNNTQEHSSKRGAAEAEAAVLR